MQASQAFCCRRILYQERISQLGQEGGYRRAAARDQPHVIRQPDRRFQPLRCLGLSIRLALDQQEGCPAAELIADQLRTTRSLGPAAHHYVLEFFRKELLRHPLIACVYF